MLARASRPCVRHRNGKEREGAGPARTAEACSAFILIKRLLYQLGNWNTQDYSCPFSAFSWHSMQCFAQGTASRRFCCISS
jgi:hypothetical protein